MSCLAPLLSCGGACVNTLADPNHCGGCGVVCPAGTLCANGSCGCAPGTMLCSGACRDPAACSCPSGWQFCNGACADVSADLANCGTCGMRCATGEVCDAGACRPMNSNACTTACGGGRTCQAGMCVCPTAQEFCAGACADTQTSDAHCGGCAVACQGGMVCEAAKCVCSGAQTDCGGECVDLQTNLAHCGMCDRPCMTGDACTAGRCAGPTGDDGCTTAALGVTVKEVAAYQSVKVPLSSGSTAIAGTSRSVAVVTGRETLFRVFVTVDSGFVARELSARLTLLNGGTEQKYFAKQSIRANSTDADTASTFQIFVPPEEIQAATRYSVEVVECTASAAGMMRAPRFPATGDTALEARNTGVIKIAIVPVQANSRLPDTSDTALAVYRDYLMAMYPTSDVQLTVTPSVTTGYPINWSGALEQVRQARQRDGAPSDMYYYGFVKPTNTMREYCQGGCTAGVGYVGSLNSGGTRIAIGLAYADETAAGIMAHEVGHNHGRNHAPCAPGGGISGVDSQYPHAGAKIGVWGYDSRSRELHAPDQATDIMGYCDNKWVSDYTYRALITRVAALNGMPLRFVEPERIARWQAVVIDADGPRWSFPFDEPGEAFGEAELAEILGANGEVLQYVTVYRTEISDITAFTVLVPEPGPGWHAIRIQGAPALAY